MNDTGRALKASGAALFARPRGASATAEFQRNINDCSTPSAICLASIPKTEIA